MAAQLVADIIKQKVEEVKHEKAEREQAVIRKKRRSKLWYFLGLLPVFLGLTIWNLSQGPPAVVFTPEELDASIRFKMFLAAQAVQAFKDSGGAWPRNLTQVGMGDQGLVYRVRDSTYTIADTTGGVPLVYHSGESLALFSDAFGVLARRKSN